ncbi:MAG: bifunctional YncE family protein/alkaline phosphatase family protein [Myxococcales bacterium]|nr:bifunctional YncE family protein/alkaline phosphatase family protein [Myxococcales bacterium]
MRARAPTTALLLVALAAGCGDPPPASSATATETATASAGETTGATTSGGDTSGATTTSAGESDTGTDTDTDGEPILCVVDPPPEATLRPGPQEGGAVIGFTGRIATPHGPSTVVDGFPLDAALHPVHDVVYVASGSRSTRALFVLDRATHEVIQTIERAGAFHGLAVAADGGRVYASRGEPGGVDVYDVGGDGTLSAAGEIAGASWSAGIAQNADGSTLWIAAFDATSITEVDAATLTVTRTIPVGFESYDVAWIPGRDELYVTEFSGEEVAIVDLIGGAVKSTLALPTSPAGLAVTPDGGRVYVAVSGADRVAAIDTASGKVVLEAPVAEPEFTDGEGIPLPNSNVGAVRYDPASGRLYAVRGADNAISILDGETLELLGSIPTALYPTDVAISPDGDAMVVTEGKGAGIAGPGGDAKKKRRGSVTFVDLGALDLASATDEAVANFRRPLDMLPFTCGDEHPLAPDVASPIEHVILIVKENKTYDCLFGELEVDAERDPALQMFPSATTPNQRALAVEFNIADNFYADAAESDVGHTALVNAHITEWVERIWQDRDEYDVWGLYPLLDVARPDRGSFFTWLVDLDVTLRIYGEIVGLGAESSKGPISKFSDGKYPGGVLVNYDVKDEDKATYVAERITAGELAEFTYLLLPNDHGVGVTPGKPTPESMVADNDLAVGIVVDALAHSPFWGSSAVFIVQDDPQGCEDHVDAHRGFITVVSPWARRGYVSHAHYSFSHIFATIERILGLPPLGRPDAAAAPMYDLFTSVPDLTPYELRPREYPEEIAAVSMPGVAASRCMDFRSPDRNPGLQVVYEEYFRWRRGEQSRAQADARISARLREVDDPEEAEEEAHAFDAEWAVYRATLRARGEAAPELPALGPAADCRQRPIGVWEDDD